MYHNPAEDLKRLLQMGNLGQSIPSSLTPNALSSFAPAAGAGGTAAATAAAPATGGMSMLMPLIAMAAGPGMQSILGGGGRGRPAPPAGRAGMGRVGPLPAIYQNNPMQFKAMLAQFLRGG